MAWGNTVLDKTNLVWVDMEMTGLDPDGDRVLEIATVVTSTQLDILAEGPVIAIHQADPVLEAMDEWNTTHHGQSGLTARVRASSDTEDTASQRTLDFLGRWVPPGCSPMCGNSICQDRRFMARHLPELERYFHYRNLDVSSLKILAQRWRPDIADSFRKQGAHLALDDILESIAELRHYRDSFLRLGAGASPAN